MLNRQPRLLIVDDDPENILRLARMLQEPAYGTISSTTDPEKAVELFLSIDADLLILDLDMPGKDGFEVLANLKSALGPDRQPSVLVYAGDELRATRQRALSGGASDFVTRPFDMDDVRLRISNLLRTEGLRRALTERNALFDLTLRELQESRIDTIERLAIVGQVRDDMTGRHNMRVASISRRIAEKIGARFSAPQLLGRVAGLHDIGKVGIPDCILLKEGPLSETEWELMRNHTLIGARILSAGRSDFMLLAQTIARSHHERWDGKGYPDGLSGIEIPLAARIVAIADVFDALSSDRPYRPAYTIEDAKAAIELGAGTQFDPSLVEAFLDIVGDETIRELGDVTGPVNESKSRFLRIIS